jgi:hypothetical protein
VEQRAYGYNKDIPEPEGGWRKDMIFHRKQKHTNAGYDTEALTPVIRCSICTGEQVAGFRRKKDGSFEEVMLIRDDGDLRQFRELYGIEGEIEKIY